MGSIQAHELSLNCKPSFVPRTFSEFLGQFSKIENVNERLLKLDDLITRLDDEMRKIEAFKRELPLSMHILNDAIVAVREEAKQCRKLTAKQVLKEFIPLKKTCDEDDHKKADGEKEKENTERMNWMSSVQLWNSDDQHCSSLESRNSKEISKPVTIKNAEEKMNDVVSNGPLKSCSSQLKGIGFVPFKGSMGFPIVVARKEEKEEIVGVPELSLQTPGTKNPRDEIGKSGLALKTGGSRIDPSSATNDQSSLCGKRQHQQHQHQISRKQRRCWSPELHRRFVDALQQLGGSQVATPKQIRELMQVDGLTNDEVKSHLQKYRLHTRRLSTTNQSDLGIWNPQDQYGESSKQSNSQSGSPEGPLHVGGASGGNSMTGGDSMEDEDGKSESHSWKSHVHLSKNISV